MLSLKNTVTCPQFDMKELLLSAARTTFGLQQASAGFEIDHLQRPVSALGLSLRAVNALRHAQLQTVGDVISWTERDLKSLPQFGPAALAALQRGLNALGLSLRQSESRHRNS